MSGAPSGSDLARWARASVAAALALGLFGLSIGYAGAIWRFFDIAGYYRIHLAGALAFGAIVSAVLNMKRWSAAAAAGLVLAVATLGPTWRSLPERPANAACETSALRVATANLWAPNPTPHLAVAALREIDADILVTQETSDAFWRAASSLRRLYPHRVARRRAPGGGWSVVLWSKLPLEGGAALSMRTARPIIAQANVVLPDDRRIGVLGVHLALPFMGPHHHRQILNLSRFAAGVAADRIILGDFNAAAWSHAMRTVEETAGARMLGGYRITWTGRYPMPLGLPRPSEIWGHQIDHILLSEGWGATDVFAAEIPGSDHRAVVARVIPPC